MALRIKKVSGLVWLVVFVAVIGIVGGGYLIFRSSTDNNQSVTNQETSLTQPDESRLGAKNENAPKGTVITSGDSEFGTMLFNNEKQAIYIWELEESPEAECYGNCAEAWPPVLTDGAPIASGSVNGELLGTTKRTDGSTQVTYNGHPLYYYAHEKAGEVKCHNISTHGGLWWVIQPSGMKAD